MTALSPSHDAVRNVTRIEEAWLTTVSLYNSLNQPTAFTETPWDGPVRQVSYTYDGAGSRITRTETGKEQAPDIYSYDREHRLTGLSQTRDATVQITVSPQQTGGVTLSPAAAAARAEATFSRRRDYSYAYDYRTRRVGRIEGGEANTVVNTSQIHLMAAAK